MSALFPAWVIFILWVLFTETGQKLGGFLLFLVIFSIILLTPVGLVLLLIHIL